VAGLAATLLIGIILFLDSTFVRRGPDSRKLVDAVLGVSCQVAFWPSLGFLLMTLRSAAREAKSLELCPTCGYDLRASPRRCPECGTPKAAAHDLR
jgi:hypothetical protein